mgnify:CR=1 FL=1
MQALAMNQDSTKMHQEVLTKRLIDMELEHLNHVRQNTDQFNYRSPKKYVSLSFRFNHNLFIDANHDEL